MSWGPQGRRRYRRRRKRRRSKKRRSKRRTNYIARIKGLCKCLNSRQAVKGEDSEQTPG